VKAVSQGHRYFLHTIQASGRIHTGNEAYLSGLPRRSAPPPTRATPATNPPCLLHPAAPQMQNLSHWALDHFAGCAILSHLLEDYFIDANAYHVAIVEFVSFFY
jgi:hypothetical protein